MTPLFRSLVVPCLVACVVAASPAPAAAQRRGGDPVPIPPISLPTTAATDAVVKGAPYAADAITTQTQVLEDGTRIERTVTAKVYRDGVGRLRREQTVLGLASLAPAADGQRVITIIDPIERVTITLDERTRTARKIPNLGYQLQLEKEPVFFGRGDGLTLGLSVRRLERATPFPNEPRLEAGADDLRRLLDQLNQVSAQGRGGRGARSGSPPADNRSTTTQLGTRQMEGVTVTGRRTTQTIPAGEIGNDRPILITDEVWESAALQVVVSLRHSDPRTGTLEYRLANVVLGEPPADLFTVPPGYTVNEAPRLPTAPRDPLAPGARGGGGGGRGGRSGGQP
jgi:hypothetical protein